MFVFGSMGTVGAKELRLFATFEAAVFAKGGLMQVHLAAVSALEALGPWTSAAHGVRRADERHLVGAESPLNTSASSRPQQPICRHR